MTPSTTISKLFLASYFMSMASAVDMLISSVTCESRPITATFSYICNGDYLCTFGEVESMEGQLTYYGLEDSYGLTNEDYVYVDANLYFSLAGYVHEQSLVEMTPVPLCNDALTADENNANGDCPADGVYAFNTNYMLPAPESDYISWAATGWEGEIVMDFYLNNTDLVGKCTLAFETMVSGAYEGGAFRSLPSAKALLITLISIAALFLSCCLYCCCCRKPTRQKSLLEESETNFHQMGHRGNNKTGNVVV